MPPPKPSPKVRIQQLEQRIVELENKLARVLVSPPAPKIKTLVHFLSPVGGIPARSGLTMGSAACTVYGCNKNGVKSSNARTETIYNDATTAVDGNKPCIAGYNDAGLLVVILEDCGA